MKIAIVGEPPRISSCFKITTEQARNLSIRGHDVQIIIQERSLSKVLEAFSGLTLHRTSIRKLRSVPLLSRASQALWNAYLLKNPENPDSWLGEGIDFGTLIVHGAMSPIWLRRSNFDAVLFETSFTAGYVLGSLRQLSARKVVYTHDSPMVWMARSYWKFRGSSVLRKYESFVINSCDQIASISSKISKLWKEEFGIPSVVIHPGCHPSPEYVSHKGGYLLSVARWQRDRKPEFLIEIMKKVRSLGLRLVVAGSWQDRDLRYEFERQVGLENLGPSIEVIGRVQERKLVDLYRGAQCLIYPVWNSFGFTALEAASQGTPIVVPSKSAIWEMFTDGTHGFAVEANNVDSYVDAVSKFCDDGLVQRMGRQAWEKSKEHNWSRHALKLDDLLRDA